MICSLSLSSQIWSNRSYGIAQWTKTYVECFTLLRSLFSKDVEWRQWLISWQILDWVQLRSRRMRMPEKKQETFKQLHQEKQHIKRARKSAGQNIWDLNRKAAAVLWKICAPTLLSNFNLQHKFVFFLSSPRANMGIFGPFDLMPDQKTMRTSCLGGFLLCWYQNFYLLP